MLQLSDLVQRVKAYHPGADTSLIEKAYAYSNRAHDGAPSGVEQRDDR